jgi:F0F1-type ATP synthase assembly protein I
MKEEKDLDQFFQTKKVYMRIGLIVLGMVVVFFLIKKMKNEYVN